MDNKFQAPLQLSDVQLQTLMLIMFAPTPTVAAQTLQTNQKANLAGQIIFSHGFAQHAHGGVEITDKGLEVLDRMNVIDKQGRRTSYGEEQFTKAVALNNANESVWPLINSVSRLV